MFYHYASNNPVRYTDPDGREPELSTAGSINGFISFLNGLDSGIGQTTHSAASEAMLRMGMITFKNFKPMPKFTAPFNKSGGNRYLYTKKAGWIDMSHFIFYAGRGYGHKVAKQEAQVIKSKWWFLFANSSYKNRIYNIAKQDPIGETVQDGYLQEQIDSVFLPWSSFSYEDLPTDKFGAIFGAEYFNPDSDLTLAEQILQFFTNVLDVTEPNFAPNYSSLPPEDSKNSPSQTNKTTNPIYVGD